MATSQKLPLIRAITDRAVAGADAHTAAMQSSSQLLLCDFDKTIADFDAGKAPLSTLVLDKMHLCFPHPVIASLLLAATVAVPLSDIVLRREQEAALPGVEQLLSQSCDGQ